MTMLKLLMIRHGESTGNREKRMAGHTNDGLSPQGRRQCRQLASHLYQIGWRPTHIYSSPLQRAVESLDCLVKPWGWQMPSDPARHQARAGDLQESPNSRESNAAAHPPAFHWCQQLAEFQAGILTGLTWADATQRYPTLCRSLETAPDWVPIPNAETPLQGRDRARQFVAELLNNHGNDDAIWIMSHHWIMEHLIAAVMGCDRTWQITMPNTAVFEFWIECDREFASEMAFGISNYWQIKRFNDDSHLSDRT